jgi:hypothetical protein
MLSRAVGSGRDAGRVSHAKPRARRPEPPRGYGVWILTARRVARARGVSYSPVWFFRATIGMVLLMPFRFSAPGPQSPTDITVEPGSSVIFVGANGGGKTRLAVHIEKILGQSAHRISAHRVLALNPSVPKISEKQALSGLRIGHTSENAQFNQRSGHRCQSNEATSLLNDFDYLVQGRRTHHPSGPVLPGPVTGRLAMVRGPSGSHGAMAAANPSRRRGGSAGE